MIRLNKQQKEIVEHPLGPILVHASAGTGKTRVLVERIIYLIEKFFIPAKRILVVTHSNLAVNEIKDRISERIESDGKYLVIGTLHSLFCNILRNVDVKDICSEMNCKFEIIDDHDKDRFLKKTFLQRNKSLNDLDDWKKNHLCRLKKKKYLETHSEKELKFEEVFEEYERFLRDRNLIDYDNILIFVCKLFRENSEIRDYWRDRFEAIFIDECQDLDEVEIELIGFLISKEKPNFLIVGDPNQNIYEFKGAYGQIFQYVKDQFPDLITKSLDENYRSAKEIVELSNKVKVDDTYKSIPVRDCFGKIEAICDPKIYLEQILSTRDFSKWAILSVRNSDFNPIVDVFIKNNIPFRTSSFKLLDNPLVKKVVCCLQIAFFDNVDLWQKFIWDDHELLKFDIEIKRNLCKYNKFGDNNKNLLLLFLQTDKWHIFKKELLPEESDKLEILVKNLKRIRNEPKDNLFKLAEKIKKELIFNEKIFEKDKFEKTSTKKYKEKLDSFLTWLKNLQSEFTDEAPENLILNLRSYAEFSKEDIKNTEHNFVTLSTIHKTKGLEFDNVIVLKSHLLKDYFDKKEQDKCLAYVAITRARDKLFLSCSKDNLQKLKNLYLKL